VPALPDTRTPYQALVGSRSLVALRPSEDLLFCAKHLFSAARGAPYAEKESGGGQIKTSFGGACRRAGIEDFSPHDCRHTWATWHYAANRDLIALMKLGGWKSERMVLRYAHVNVSQLAPSIAAGLAAWDTKSAPSESEKSGTYGGSNRCANLRAPLVRERS
jgi:integrase